MQDITSVEQMAVYEHNGVIAERFVGIYTITKLLKSLDEYFQDQSVDLMRAQFACMDTTTVDLGERGGLKQYLKNTIPHLIWVECGNHKLELCFKHLLNQFPSIFGTDVFLESLWKFSNTDH